MKETYYFWYWKIIVDVEAYFPWNHKLRQLHKQS